MKNESSDVFIAQLSDKAIFIPHASVYDCKAFI